MAFSRELEPNFSFDQLNDLVKSQQEFFAMRGLQKIETRISILKKLKQLIQENEQEFIQSLYDDLGKSPFEAYVSEIGFIYEELNQAIKHTRKWSKAKRVSSPLVSWPSKSYILPQPKGNCLIIAPWNYPFQLVIGPLIAAIAAGNNCILKAPEQSTSTSALLEKIIHENFPTEIISVVQGPGKTVVTYLLEKFQFGHVFFTGSVPVGRIIAQACAKKLMPCTLELGGKSPAIVDASANLKVAAQRIAFGKWLNAGQTCVAPDYLLVDRSVLVPFLKLLKETIESFYGEKPFESKDYGRIVNEAQFDRLVSYLAKEEIYFGGETDRAQLKISPTIIVNPSENSALKEDEIFGPILPIIPFDFTSEIENIIAQQPNPLALYHFSEDRKLIKQLSHNISFGGGAINNTVIHLANPELPFGGIGSSGSGNYHGKFGFDAFSHQKAIMHSATRLDLKQKYPPFGPLVYKAIRWLMK
jgi:aldehyde dehydrogenase (NAD+)